ncbi:MAG: hypothetical protein ACTSXQ_02075 [Alphaproteobacteria bacterium]
MSNSEEITTYDVFEKKLSEIEKPQFEKESTKDKKYKALLEKTTYPILLELLKEDLTKESIKIKFSAAKDLICEKIANETLENKKDALEIFVQFIQIAAETNSLNNRLIKNSLEIFALGVSRIEEQKAYAAIPLKLLKIAANENKSYDNMAANKAAEHLSELASRRHNIKIARDAHKVLLYSEALINVKTIEGFLPEIKRAPKQTPVQVFLTLSNS